MSRHQSSADITRPPPPPSPSPSSAPTAAGPVERMRILPALVRRDDDVVLVPGEQLAAAVHVRLVRERSLNAEPPQLLGGPPDLISVRVIQRDDADLLTGLLAADVVRAQAALVTAVDLDVRHRRQLVTLERVDKRLPRPIDVVRAAVEEDHPFAA